MVSSRHRPGPPDFMPGNSATPIVPPIRVRDVNNQLRDLLTVSYSWVMEHWLEIIIAVAVAAVIVSGLIFLRRLGNRLCTNSPSLAGWGAVFGRAIVKTGN